MDVDVLRQKYEEAQKKLNVAREWVSQNPEHYSCAIRLQRSQADVKYWAKQLAAKV